jgi:integrase
MGKLFKKRGKWHIDFEDANGHRHRRKVGGSKKVANEMLTFEEDQANHNKIGVFEESSISAADAADQWLASLRPDLKPRTVEKWKQIVRSYLKPAFRSRLSAVTADVIAAYIKERCEVDRLGNATVNGHLAVLRLIFVWALERDRPLIRRTPFRNDQGLPVKKIQPLKEPPPLEFYLNDEQRERLLSETRPDPYLHAATLVAINTAMRLREVHGLTRTSINWTNRTTHLTETKNGKARTVQLNDTAIEALKSLPHRLDGTFFPFSADSLTTRFTRAARRAGLSKPGRNRNNFTFHSLKHHNLSAHAANGIAGKPLSALGGHSTSSMTDRYVAVSDTFQRQAVDALQIGKV